MIAGALVKGPTNIDSVRIAGRRTRGARQGFTTICLIRDLATGVAPLGTAISSVIVAGITLWTTSAVTGGATVCLVRVMTLRHRWGERGPYRSFTMTQRAPRVSAPCTR